MLVAFIAVVAIVPPEVAKATVFEARYPMAGFRRLDGSTKEELQAAKGTPFRIERPKDDRTHIVYITWVPREATALVKQDTQYLIEVAFRFPVRTRTLLKLSTA